MVWRSGVAVAVLAAVACGGKAGGAAGTRDAAGGDPSPGADATTDGAIAIVDGQIDAAESAAGPDAFVSEVPDAFPDDCVTALHLVAAAGKHLCELSPGDVACESTNDCVVNLIPLCCGSDAVGANRDASFLCPPQNCPPPPPPGPVNDCTPSVATEDCRVVAARQNVGVACVNHQCLTYAVGP
jgi:hypothetical protein